MEIFPCKAFIATPNTPQHRLLGAIITIDHILSSPCAVRRACIEEGVLSHSEVASALLDLLQGLAIVLMTSTELSVPHTVVPASFLSTHRACVQALSGCPLLL